MRKTIFLTILLALLSVVAIQAQTIKNSSIAVQPTLDNTVPFSFNPLFRYDTTSMILYVYDDGEWTMLADGSAGGGGSPVTSLSADSVTYDPSGSVLVSTDAQGAIDELALNQGILDSYYAGLKCDSTTIVQAADTTYTVFTCYKSGAVVQRDTVFDKLGSGGSADGVVTSGTVSGSTLSLTRSEGLSDVDIDVSSLQGGGGSSASVGTTYIAALGQSNMAGRDASGDRSVNPLVYLADADGSKAVWDISSSNNTPGFQYAKRLQEETGDTIVVFFVAASGRSISYFTPTGSMYINLDSTIENHGDPLLHSVVWMQGEADRDESSSGINEFYTGEQADSNYLAYLYDSVYYNFVQQEWFNETTPFVCGLVYDQPGAGHEGITRNNALRSLGTDSVAWTTYIESNVLESFDNLHFSGTAVDTMGFLYYEAVAGLPYYEKYDYISEIPDPELSFAPDDGVITFTQGEQSDTTALSFLFTNKDESAANVYDWDGSTYSVGDTVSVAEWENWNGLLVKDTTAAGVTYYHPVQSSGDSTLRNSTFWSTRFADVPYDTSAIRVKYSWAIEAARGGLVIGVHAGDDNGGGYIIANRGAEIEVYRTDPGATNFALVDENTNAITSGAQFYDDVEAQLLYDSTLLVMIEGDTVINYTIPLANRFDAPYGVGWMTNISSTGAQNGFSNMRVIRGDGPVTTIDGLGLEFVDNSDINFTVTNSSVAAELESDIELTGDPKTPTPSAGDDDTSIATTEFVQGEIETATSGTEGRSVRFAASGLEDGDWLTSGGVTRSQLATAIGIPDGGNATRPGSPQNGDLRFNTDGGSPEIYMSGEWFEFEMEGYNKSGMVSGTPDGNGDLTVTHNLPITPTSIQVSATGTTIYHVQPHSEDGTSFKIRVWDSSNAIVTSGTVNVYWTARN